MLVPALSLLARLVLGVVFVTSAIGKLRVFDSFVDTVEALRCPRPFAKASAATLIVCEAGTGVLLVIGMLPRLAAAAAFMLVVLFAGVSVQVLVRGEKIACHCFGPSERNLGRDTLATSVMLAVPAVTYVCTLGATRPLSSVPPLAVLVFATLTCGSILIGRWVLLAPTIVRIRGERRLWINRDAS